MGAWIETWIGGGAGPKTAASHPVWVRGLKPTRRLNANTMIKVAPRVGAWIETSNPICYCIDILSHPVWVRGLKQSVKSVNFKP